jgi:hypothetical protein
MKTKQRKRQKKRVRRYLEPWCTVLGLNWYAINCLWYDKEKEFLKGNGTAVFRVWPDWRYMTANVSVNMPAVKRLTDDELERAVVHELVHVLVNEMRETGINHEERLVTMLTKAMYRLVIYAADGRVLGHTPYIGALSLERYRN